MLKSSGINPDEAAKNIPKLKSVIAFSTNFTKNPLALMQKAHPLPQEQNLTLGLYISKSHCSRVR
jgi:hypothetical protein